MDIKLIDLLRLATEPCEKRGALLTGKEEVTLDCPINLTMDQINTLLSNHSDVTYNEECKQIVIDRTGEYVTPRIITLQMI